MNGRTEDTVPYIVVKEKKRTFTWVDVYACYVTYALVCISLPLMFLYVPTVDSYTHDLPS